MTKIKMIAISPTNTCNFECKHCGIIKSNEINSVPLKTVERILKRAYKNGAKCLKITGGGEPLLDFEKTVKIVKLAKRNRLKVTLNTNGYFIANPDPENAIRKLKGIDMIIFSVDYDHLKFIPYSHLLNVIIATLSSRTNVQIKIANRKATKYKNSLLLKKLSKDLDGKLVNLTPLVGNLHFMASYYLIFAKKIVSVISFDAMRTDANKKIKGFKQMGLKNVLFTPCKEFNPIVEFNSNILPCCSFTSINNLKLYTLGKVMNKNKDMFEVSDSLLKSILFDNFPFMKIFLRIRKDRKLFNKFLKQKYYSPCDFCLEVLKHKKKIDKIKSPSNYEILIFSISNMHYVLINSFKYVLMNFYGILFNRIQFFIEFLNEFYR